MSEVRKGQLWADNDKRCSGRKLRIHEVTATHAVAYAWNPNDTEGKTTRIRLDRFKPTSTGYRLIEDVPA